MDEGVIEVVIHIPIDGYTFKCHIGHYSPEVPGVNKWYAASDWDCYGSPAEVEFDCYGIAEDGVDFPEWEAKLIFNEYESLVEKKILEAISKTEEDYEL